MSIVFKVCCAYILFCPTFPSNHLSDLNEDGHFMTAFVVIHFQCLCQQSSLASFSKTPQALSLIRPFSVGKYHGNGAGKSLYLGYRNKHLRKKHKHTLLLPPEFPTRVGQLTYPPWPRGLTSQSWAVIKADTQVELLLSATRYQLQEQPQVL